MSMLRLGCVLASAITLVGFVAACSDDDNNTGTTSSSSGGNGNGSGNGNGDGNGNGNGNGTGGGKCEVAPGTYTAKYTTKPGGTGPGGMACTEIPEQEITVSEDTDGGSGGPVEEQEGCTIERDEANCTFTSKCVQSQSGYTTTTEMTMSIKDGKVTGSTTSKTVQDSDGSTLSDCGYDFEWTKK